MLNRDRLSAVLDFFLTRFLVVLFFAILIVYASREILDLDLWLHLKTGETIVRNRAVPLEDIFSFTRAGAPWFNHEWLFQVIVFLFHQAAGVDGFIYLQNIIVISIFLSLFFFGIHTQGKNYVLIYVVLYLALLTVSHRFTVRPDIFSLLFLCAFLVILRAYAQNGSKAIWTLPLLQVLWVNCHGFAFTGPFLVILMLAAEIVKRSLRLPWEWSQVNRLTDERLKRLTGLLAVLFAAFLVNPAGWKGAAYPFSVLGQISGEGKIIFQYIQELARPLSWANIADPRHLIYYKAFILLSLFSFRHNQRRADLTDLLWWSFFLCFSLVAVRNIAYFAMAGTFVIFTNCQEARKNGRPIPAILKIPSPLARRSIYYASLLFLIVYPVKGAAKYLDSASYSFDTYELKSGLWGIALDRFPEKATKFLLAHDFPARMFNDFNSGSYLIGHAYPRRQVFIDGRTEFYGPKFFRDYVDIGDGKASRIAEAVERYGLSGFFLTNSTTDLHTGLLKYLFNDPGWGLVYFDDDAVIFLKKTPENQPLLERYRIDLKDWSPRVPDFQKLGIAFRFPAPFIKRAQLLDALGCYVAAAREARLALEIQPSNAEALKILSNYYYETGDYGQAFKFARNSLVYAPGDILMRSRLALIYHGLGEDEKALKVIDAVIKKSPKYPGGYYAKAKILLDKDPAQAKKLCAQAIKIRDKEPRYRVLMGDLLEQEGDLPAAKKEWAAAFEYDATNEELAERLKDS